MTDLRVRRVEGDPLDPLSVDNPLPVSLEGPDGPGGDPASVVAVGLTKSFRITPGSQGAGAAYATGDAIGTMFEIPNAVRSRAKSGVLHSVTLYDMSDQGIAIDLVLFNAPFTPSADNAAFAVSDADMAKCIGSLSFSTFKDFGANQVSTLTGIGLAFNCYTGTSIFGQMVARGAPTVTAGAEYGLLLTCLLD